MEEQEFRRIVREEIRRALRDELQELAPGLEDRRTRIGRFHERLDGELEMFNFNNRRLEFGVDMLLSWTKGADAWKSSVCKYDGCKS